MNLRYALFVVVLIVATGNAAGANRKVTDPDAPRSLPAEGTVSVRWEDPEQFSEIRRSGNRTEARRGNWVEELASYLRDHAEKRLPAGERLEVNIVDLQRAGNFEPGRGAGAIDVRVVREIYSPSMTLAIQRIGADGQVIAEGERKLSDLSFMHGTNARASGDPLRYEKNMIDRWLAREFDGPGVDGS